MQVFGEQPRNMQRSSIELSLNDLAKIALAETLAAVSPKTCMNHSRIGGGHTTNLADVGSR